MDGLRHVFETILLSYSRLLNYCEQLHCIAKSVHILIVVDLEVWSRPGSAKRQPRHHRQQKAAHQRNSNCWYVHLFLTACSFARIIRRPCNVNWCAPRRMRNVVTSEVLFKERGSFRDVRSVEQGGIHLNPSSTSVPLRIASTTTL